MSSSIRIDALLQSHSEKTKTKQSRSPKTLAKMPLIDIFPEPDEMKLSALFLMMTVYGYILMRASAVIGDGSEMLMLLYGPGIVGGIVIPILGAVPDCAVILISGMGEGTTSEVQHQLSVGVGTLVGSTIMLLTIPWGLGVFLGRREYDEDQDCAAQSKKSKLSLLTNCVTVLPDIPPTGRLMILSLSTYLVIQIPSLFFESDTDGGVLREKPWALACLIFSAVSFCYYCYTQVQGAEASERDRRKQETSRRDNWKRELDSKFSEKEHQKLIFELYDKDKSGYIEAVELSEALEHLGLKCGRKDVHELMAAIDVGHEQDGDVGHSDGRISRNEFMAAIDLWVSAGQNPQNLAPTAEAKHKEELALLGNGSRPNSQQSSKHSSKQSSKSNLYGSTNDSRNGSRAGSKRDLKSGSKNSPKHDQKQRKNGKDEHKDEHKDVESQKRVSAHDDNEGEEDDEDEEEEEYWHLSDKELRIRACLLLLAGTLCVTLFSDPMVDVITQVGDRLNVSPFYVAFIVTPLASNASEVYAGLLFAKKKTSESISMTLATLHGAATMNNTLALSIFMAIIYARGLEWDYTAEVLTVMTVVTIVGAQVVWRRNIFLWQGLFVLSLYPLSILMIWSLQTMGLK